MLLYVCSHHILVYVNVVRSFRVLCSNCLRLDCSSLNFLVDGHEAIAAMFLTMSMILVYLLVGVSMLGGFHFDGVARIMVFILNSIPNARYVLTNIVSLILRYVLTNIVSLILRYVLTYIVSFIPRYVLTNIVSLILRYVLTNIVSLILRYVLTYVVSFIPRCVLTNIVSFIPRYVLTNIVSLFFFWLLSIDKR